MGKKKNIFLFLLLICSLVVLSGCSSKDGKQTTTDKGGEKISFRVAGQSPVDNPDTIALYAIAEKIAEDSNGRLEMNVYPASQLGDYTVAHEEIMRGTIEMGLISTSPEHDDRLLIGYMPYIARNYTDVRELFKPDSFMYNTYNDIHKDLNTEFLGFWAEGLGVIGTTKKPVNIGDPTQDKGLLIRTPPIDGVRLSVTEQGYRSTSIDYSDLYSALETGIADGWVGGSELLNYTSFRDVINYIVPVNHFFEATFFLANQDFWDGLSAEDQNIIKTAVEEKSVMSLEKVEEINMGYREKLEEAGIEVLDISDEELQDITDHVRKEAWPKLEKLIGKDLLDSIKENLPK